MGVVDRIIQLSQEHAPVPYPGDDFVTGFTAQDDREYFRRRAVQELERAQAGGHPAVVASHYGMATQYLDRVSADPVRLR